MRKGIRSRTSSSKLNTVRGWVEPLEGRQLFANIYVDAGATGSVTDGTSWTNAYRDLQSALTAASSGDQIRVAGGVYRPTTGTDRLGSFVLKGGVELFGGYAGSAIPANPDARDTTAYRTTLSGEIGSPSSIADNSYHVLKAVTLTGTATVDGLTVTGGNANGPTSGPNQGAEAYGGGLYVSGVGTTVAVNDVVFVSNNAYDGGAFMVRGGNLTLTNSTFDHNVGAFRGGAGYVIDNATATLARTTFVENAAPDGAGVWIYQSVVNATDSTFLRNRTTAGSGGAGALLYVQYATGTVTGCTFNGNQATHGAGIYVGGGATVAVVNSTFVGNTATSAYAAAAIDLNSASLSIASSTFYYNRGGAGAIYAVGPTAPVTIVNTISWDPASTSTVNGTTSMRYSLIMGGMAGPGMIGGTPQFVRTPSPGANGVWGDTDDDYGNLRLLKTSPGVDAGENASVPSGVTRDRVGAPRFADVASKADTGSGTGAIVDMGAYEVVNDGNYTAPAVLLGGPFIVNERGSLQLAAVAVAGEDGLTITSYEWDFAYSGGTFHSDATGPQPMFSAADLDGNSSRTIALRVTDSAGQSTLVTATVHVFDVAPTLTLTGASSAAEGASYTLNFSASDPGPDAVTQWVIDWGDGTTSTVAGTALSATHTYADGPGTRVITAVATNDDGEFAAASPLTVTVTGVAPVADSFSATSVLHGEASIVTFGGAVDPSAADTAAGFLYSFDLDDDGTFEVVDSPNASAAFFATPGTHTVAGRIKDKDGAYTSYLTSFTVAAAPPPLSRNISGNTATYVRDRGFANRRFGSAGALVAKLSGPGATRQSFVKFDLTNLGANSVLGAKIRLYGKVVGKGGVPISVTGTGSDWAESTLTWNTRQAAENTVLTTAEVIGSTGKWYELDVTAFVNAELAAGRTMVSFAVAGTVKTEAQAVFNSDDAKTNKPQLQVQTLGQILQGIVVAPNAVAVREGGHSGFDVSLVKAPTADVTVTVTRQPGDEDLSSNVATLTFTPDNWDEPQTVLVSAASDSDMTHGAATFALESLGLTTRTVTATEFDVDASIAPATIKSTEAAFVRDGGFSAKRFNGDPTLTLKRDGYAGNTREVYVKFDLSSLASVSSATLRLYGKITDARRDAAVDVNIHGAADSTWTEAGLTWNNKPAAGDTVYSTFSVTSGTSQWYDVGVTGFIQAELAAGRTEVTLVLKVAGTNSAPVVFATDEQANGPQLAVS